MNNSELFSYLESIDTKQAVYILSTIKFDKHSEIYILQTNSELKEDKIYVNVRLYDGNGNAKGSTFLGSMTKNKPSSRNGESSFYICDSVDHCIKKIQNISLLG